MLFKLIQRTDGPPYSFKGTDFERLDEAVRAARESDRDYVIEEPAHGVVPRRVVKYRVGQFEMG